MPFRLFIFSLFLSSFVAFSKESYGQVNPYPLAYCCLDSDGYFTNGGDGVHCCSVPGGKPSWNIDDCTDSPNPNVQMSGDLYRDPNPCNLSYPTTPYCCCNAEQCLSGDGQYCCSHPLHLNIDIDFPGSSRCLGVSTNGTNLMTDPNSCNNTLIDHYSITKPTAKETKKKLTTNKLTHK